MESEDSVVASGSPLLPWIDCDSVTSNVEEGLNVVLSPVKVVYVIVEFCDVTDSGVVDEIIEPMETED